IKSNVRPKMKDDKPFTGSELVFLLRLLVNAANTGSLTEIPNRWDAFLDRLKQSSIEECFKFYQAHMRIFLVDRFKNEPVNSSQLEDWHRGSEEKSFTLLSHWLQGLEKFLESSRRTLSEIITKSCFSTKEINKQKIQMKIFNIRKEFEMQISDQFLLLNYPMLSSEITRFGDNLTSTYSARLVAEMADLVHPE